LVPTPRQVLLCLPCSLFSVFVFFFKWHFCLLKIALQGVSLWHFHVYMYYSSNRFMPSIFLLSTLVSFLQWLQQVKKFYIYSCIKSTSLIFTLLSSFFTFLLP
jgi:hypothetical protein